MKKKPARWMNVVKYASLCDDLLVRRLPPKPVPVLARPGMAVSMYNVSSNIAVIVDVTPEFCIVQEESGRAWALHWHEVELAVVQPDPAAVRKAA